MATRRIVAPVLHCRPVESHLMQVVRQAAERGMAFHQLIETPENQRQRMCLPTFRGQDPYGFPRYLRS